MEDQTGVEALERDAFLAEAELLARLTQTIGWEQYEALLTNMRTGALEEMAQSSPGEFPYWQGVVATLATIIERPHTVVATASAVHNEEQDQAEKLLEVKRSLELTPGMIDEL